MIKELSLVNFQSHEDNTLRFHEGVNIIVGPTDSGKTAIIRALKWIIFNRPSGEEFRSRWGGKTKIEVFTDNAHIVRTKDKENEYILGDTHFKAFGTGVPQEIINAFNIEDINLQQQLDSIFLLSQSPGQVAEFFNKVAKLEKIDTATQNINAWIRGIAADIKYKEAEEKSVESQLTAYEDLDKFEIEVEDLEQAESEMNMLAADVIRLRNSIKSIQNCQTHLTESSRILQLNDSVTALVDDILTMRTTESHATKLYLALEKVKTTAADIEVETKMLTLDEPVEELLLLIGAKDALQTDSRNISSLLGQIVQTNAASLKSKENAVKLEEKFHDGMGDTCILCGQPIKKNKI